MTRNISLLLGLTLTLYVLNSAISVSGNVRLVREVAAPAPIDCQLSSWSEWGECDPCTELKYRSRSIVKFGQYGGARCLSSLGDSQRCQPVGPCERKPIDCGNDYECETGRCIKTRLLCNNDNDCGDNSDESCDDREPKPTCRNMDIELSELARTAGDGVNILGMQARRNPFDNEYFHGTCERVWDGNTRKHYRKSHNVASLVFQTRADKEFTTDTFEDSTEVIAKIYQERASNFDASFSIKVTPTEGKKDNIGASLGINYSKNESLNSIKTFLYKTNKTYLKVSGSIQLGTFQMRTRNPALSQIFLEDLESLPMDYEKADYFSFLEMYGTHYSVSGSLGGIYNLIYVLDSTIMKQKAVTSKDVKECLGFNLGINAEVESVNLKAEIKNPNCATDNNMGGESPMKTAVIEQVIPFVEGGTLVPATALHEKLAKSYKDLDVEDYVRWAATLMDAPTIIKRKLSPIYTLIPHDMKDAYTKSKNLERATEEYIHEHSTCKCQPCQNGGTAIVLDGECVCKCSIDYSGIACQTPKAFRVNNCTLYTFEFTVAKNEVDGRWGCWSPVSSCKNEEIILQRQCNNPAPSRGGKPCSGETTKTLPCVSFSATQSRVPQSNFNNSKSRV